MVEPRLREFGPLGLIAMAAVLAASVAGPVAAALLILVWASVSGTPPRALGFTTPRKVITTLAGATALGIALKLVLKATIMPLFGAPPVNPQYQYLAGNMAALPGIIATVLVSAGLAEELVFRGYLFERFDAALGRTRAAVVVTVLSSATLFALAHYHDQGLPGLQQSAVTGLVFAALYAWRRELWLVVVAHVAFNLTAVALIYWQWEASVARLVFH